MFEHGDSETKLFLTGMFRSGTTMLARMLASHGAIAFASDPFSRIFKSLRNSLAEHADLEIDPASPLDDYYFSPQGIQLLSLTKSVPWSEIDTRFDGEEIAKAASIASMPYSPDLAPLLSSIRGANFRELFLDGLRLVHEVYGSGATRVVGFKDVWTTEFVPGFLETFPNARAVCLIRDPRAVYLSKRNQKERYPLLFMARQWRKLAALAWLWSRDQALSDRVLIVRYEDLVSNPEESAVRMAEFISIENPSSMTDPESWMDGGGEVWKQNTSFGEGASGFDVKAADRWRTQLPEVEARLIESLCAPEMSLFGYTTLSEPWSRSSTEIMRPSLVPSDRLAEWIRPYVDESTESLSRAYLIEHMRYEVLNSNQTCDDDLKSLLCLHPEIFSCCQSTTIGMSIQ